MDRCGRALERGNVRSHAAVGCLMASSCPASVYVQHVRPSRDYIPVGGAAGPEQTNLPKDVHIFRRRWTRSSGMLQIRNSLRSRSLRTWSGCCWDRSNELRLPQPSRTATANNNTPDYRMMPHRQSRDGHDHWITPHTKKRGKEKQVRELFGSVVSGFQ